MQHYPFEEADLAPGDRRSKSLRVEDIELHRVVSMDDPLFAEAYEALQAEFGASNELEAPEVLARRLEWDRHRGPDGTAMRYDLLLYKHRGQFAAVQDQIAVADDHGVIVHFSHILISPEWRRTGLAGWLRALPLQTARACLRDAGLAQDLPITVAAEVEYLDDNDVNSKVRLMAFGRAGFQKVDPGAVSYLQPDFRDPAVIDAAGGPLPLPFQLVIRRVGREGAPQISGAEVRAIVERLYRVYARSFREQDMAPLWAQLAAYPPPEAQIDLVAPYARQND